MKKINEEKWKRLKSFEDILNEEVGVRILRSVPSLRHVSRLTIMQNCLRNSASSRR